ncbi:hypothetical protein KKF86_02425, partial [bacterium]|nr:hypothetical protein [bacterium]
MKNIMIKTLTLCLLVGSAIFAQIEEHVTIFIHSNMLTLDTKQIDIYNTITKQQHVVNPKVIIYKNQLELKEYTSLDLNVNKEKSIIAKTSELINRNQKHWTWIGTIAEKHADEGYAFITLNENNLSGEIWTKDYMYRIVPLGDNKGLLFEVDHSKIEYEVFCNSGNNVQNYNSNNQMAPKILSGTTYDALVCYTVAAKNGAGGTTAMHSLIDNMETQTNLIYDRSSSTPEINIVYKHLVNYSETNNLLTDVNRLRINGDGYMDEIHNLRSDWGADVVVLITETGGAVCGQVNGDYSIP